ncbi:MAG: SOS response-associated peptidase family protein [Pontixanthobacter sp.]
MCNLYRMTQSVDEVAAWFDAVNDAGGANFGSEIYPGYPGTVVADGRVRVMNWGFPLQRTGAKGQALKPKPINNARTDKLKSFFWRDSFEQRRCLIPASGWAEAEGKKGAMTRSWFFVPDRPVFALAGIWRSSDEWGDSYAMVMTDAVGPAAEVHSRMPVMLHRDDFACWTGGEPAAAFDLCRGWDGPLGIDRTDQKWARERGRKRDG